MVIGAESPMPNLNINNNNFDFDRAFDLTMAGDVSFNDKLDTCSICGHRCPP